MVSPIYQAFPRYVDAVEKDQRCVPYTPRRLFHTLSPPRVHGHSRKGGGVLETLFLWQEWDKSPLAEG